MIGTPCVLALGVLFPGQVDAGGGVIRGLVVNASRGRDPCADTEVVLRVRLEGQFTPVAETVTNQQGKFVFADLPIGDEYLYLPGANHDDVHYPGPRVRLKANQAETAVRVEVCDSQTFPNPLIIRKFDIQMQTLPGALRVTESMVVENPTRITYVGAGDGPEPVTLHLAIPSDFERTTFHEEFYGRQFSMDDGKLVTSIPWTPGSRHVKFTYTIRNEDKHRIWLRPVDLPCESVRVQIDHHNATEVFCDLPRSHQTDDGQWVFESDGEKLDQGHVLRVQMGQLPLTWMAYARWSALGLLTVLVGAVCAVVIPKRQRIDRSTDSADLSATRVETGRPPRGRRSRRRGKRPIRS